MTLIQIEMRILCSLIFHFTATPFHQLPILEFEGEMLGQSIAIARFLAKKYNFYGKDEMEQARADAIVDYVSDYNNSE